MQTRAFDFLELKVLAISSRNLLDAWKKRHSEGAEHPLKNGFKIQPEHRLEHQAVFRLSVSHSFCASNLKLKTLEPGVLSVNP